ncbi:MAG: circularly permuted type 2 ATP-grasp protein [Bacteroidia bacterium]
MSLGLDSEAFLQRYKAGIAHYDEMWDHVQGLRPHWHHLLGRVRDLGLPELHRRRAELDRMLRENGVTYHVYDDPRGQSKPWLLDPLPLVLDAATWRQAEAGLRQRAFLLDLVLRDLYGPAHLLRQGILPPELVYADWRFLRPCYGTLSGNTHQLLLYAADLSRGPDGRIWVVGDRTQAPSGWAYTLENRIAMARVLPDLFTGGQVSKLAGFYQRMQASIADFAPFGNPAPRIVLLTPGPMNETYFEHAYLSVFQGITLVQGQDLTVRDDHVWLKTLEGLEKVDIIIRRVDDDFCDPLELRPESQLGVPGLLEAVRQGNVVVANPLGSGVLENPGLMAFMPTLCRHLLGEDLILPNIATWWCGQTAACDHVLDHLPQMIVKSLDRRPAIWQGSKLTTQELADLKQQIRSQPYLYVGQEEPIYATVPVLNGQHLEPRHTVLRAFSIATSGGYEVMPGGLSRSSQGEGIDAVSNQRGSINKDTWVLGEDASPELRFRGEEALVIPAATKGESLPSRTAENLFWVGRYSNRVLMTARIMRSVLWEWSESKNFSQQYDDQCLRNLLGALTHTTMTYPGFVGKDSEKRLRHPEKELRAIILDPARAGGLAFTTRLWINASYAVRDRWSADTWRIFDSVEDMLSSLRHHRRIEFRHIRNTLDQTITALAAFQGLNTEGMTGDEGRFMYDIGRRIEQGLIMSSLVRSTMSVVHDEAVEYAMLEALLQSLESLNIYRYRYRSRLRTATVLHMLLLDIQYPRSLVYALQHLSKRLDQLPGRDTLVGTLREDQRLVLEAFSRLRLAEVPHLMARTPDSYIYQHLDRLMADTGARLAATSDAITRIYFNHAENQHQIAPMPEL